MAGMAIALLIFGINFAAFCDWLTALHGDGMALNE